MTVLKFLIKLAIAAAIIWLVWDKVDFLQMKFILANPVLITLIPICWLLNQILTTLRLHTVLHALGRATKLNDVFRANMCSLFIGNLMPGVIGADAVKFFYLKRHDPSILNAQLVLVLALDRVLGLVAVLFWCSVFSFFINTDGWGQSSGVSTLFIYVPAAIFVLIILGFLTLSLVIGYISRFKLPIFIFNFFDTYRYLVERRNNRSLAIVMGYNLMAVFVVLAGLVLVGGQLQLQQSGEEMIALQFFLIPLVLIAAMLPLTPLGLGVAQITMAGAYGLFGLEASVGVSISTLSQLGLLSVSILVGGVFFLLSKNDVGHVDVISDSGINSRPHKETN